MFIVRSQFKKFILEQDFLSESQAIVRAHMRFNTGAYQHVTVIDQITQEEILSLGTDPDEIARLAYAKTK